MPLKKLAPALAGFVVLVALFAAAASAHAQDQDPCRPLTGREKADCSHAQAVARSAANKAAADARKSEIRAQSESNKEADDAQRPEQSVRNARAARTEPSAEAIAAAAQVAAAKAAKNEAGTGQVMLDHKEYAGALPHLTAACDAGLPDGCYNLGQLYDEAGGGLQDKARAVTFFDKGCTGGFVGSCLRAGNIYMGAQGVAPDKEQQLKYFRASCQGVGNQNGRIEGCEHWDALQPGANIAWATSMLTNDPNVGTTLKEQSLVISDPRVMGQLCSAHNERACFAIMQTIEGLHFSDVVGNPEHHFTHPSLQPIQIAMRDFCKAAAPPGMTPLQHEGYCRVSYMVDYAIVHNFGPAAEDPTRCVRIAGTYTTTDYYWVDRDGHKTFKDSSHSPSGTDVENDCPYAVDYADFASDVVVIHPHELFKANLEINEFLTNMNSPKVRYIKKHEVAAVHH